MILNILQITIYNHESGIGQTIDFYFLFGAKLFNVLSRGRRELRRTDGL